MAKILSVSTSGYYTYLKSKPSRTEKENTEISNEIKFIYESSRSTYGSPRIWAELCHHGRICSRKRVARLMRENDIVAKMKKRFKVTTRQSSTQTTVAPNLLKQNFCTEKPNTVWVSDVSYIYTSAGWLYLAIVLDLFSRKIVGTAMSDRLQTTLILKALKQALQHRKPCNLLIHHSDRGCQYTSRVFSKFVKSNGITLSMSSAGNCYDNAVAESFFHTLKTEHVYFNHYETRDEAMKSIFEYIEVFYNRQRSHSTLGYLSPVEF